MHSKIRSPMLALSMLLAAWVPWSHAAAIDAEAFSLDAYRGQVVYLDFWASWCGPCKASFPWMQSMHHQYANREFQIVAVNVDTQRQAATEFLREQGVSFDVVFDPDGQIASQYGLLGMPSSFLIGRDGRVLLSHKGFKTSDQPILEDQIRAALSGAKVTATEDGNAN